MTEEELIKSIADAQFDVDSARFRVASAKKELAEAESKFTGCKLHLEILEEQLRVVLFYKPTYELSAREKEIAEFKEKLPDLLKRIK